MTTKTEQRQEQEAQRKRYMEGSLTHQEYYLWLADFIGATKKHVPFSQEQINNSKDEHLNDLPMAVWDRQDFTIRRLAYAKGLAWSQSDTVCVLKTLAKLGS